MVTSVDVLVEDMILEPDKANGGVSTAQDVTPDIVKGIDVGGQDARNDVFISEDTAWYWDVSLETLNLLNKLSLSGSLSYIW